MSTTTSRRSSSEILEALDPTLHAKAEAVGTRDAGLAIPPGVPRPTLGEVELQTLGTRLRSEVDEALTREHRDRQVELDQGAAVLAADHDEEDVDFPARITRRRVRSWEVGLIGLLAVGETYALSHPMGTIQDLAGDSPERFLWPLVLAVIGAVAAHQAAEGWATARRSRVPAEQTRGRRRALSAVVVLVVIGLSAVGARAWASQLDAQLSTGQPADPASLGLFAAFQVAFAAGSVLAATNLIRRQESSERDARDAYLDEVRQQQVELGAALEGIDEDRTEARLRVAQATEAASAHYWSCLVERHPSAEGQMGWMHRLNATAPAPAAAAPVRLPKTSPVPAPTVPPAPTAPPAPAPAPAPVPAGEEVDEDLFAAILGVRP